MALVPEDGTGLANANTYNDRAAVAAHHAARPGRAAWAALSGADQDAHNLFAAEWLDASYPWLGEIATDAQGMRFPRSGLKDRDGREIATTVVPTAIRRAHCEASWLSSQGALADPSSGDPGRIRRVKADSVEVEYATGGAQLPAAPASNAAAAGAAEYIDRLLYGLFRAPTGRVRLLKA